MCACQLFSGVDDLEVASGSDAGSGASGGSSGSGAAGGAGAGGSAGAGGAGGSGGADPDAGDGGPTGPVGYALWASTDTATIVKIDPTTGSELGEKDVLSPSENYDARALMPIPDGSVQVLWSGLDSAVLQTLSAALVQLDANIVYEPPSASPAAPSALARVAPLNARAMIWNPSVSGGNASAYVGFLGANDEHTSGAWITPPTADPWVGNTLSTTANGVLRLIWAGIAANTGSTIVAELTFSLTVSGSFELPPMAGMFARAYFVESDARVRVSWGDDGGNGRVCAFAGEPVVATAPPPDGGWGTDMCVKWTRSGKIFRGYFPPAL